MQKRAILVLSVLVLALGVHSGVVFSRLEKLSERVEGLERRPTLGARAAPAREDASSDVARLGFREAAPAPLSASSAEPAKTAPPAPAPAEAFTPAQQSAIVREVERQLRERGPRVDFEELQDPLSVMEKELALSPAQKIRIEALWKEREEEQRKLFGKGFAEGPLDHGKKIVELEERYDLAIKRELDFPQQQKYDALKKEGKLHGGMVFRVQLKSEAEKK